MAKETMLNFRVTVAEKEEFSRKALQIATPSLVLRELALAFMQGRIVIEINPPTVKDVKNV